MSDIEREYFSERDVLLMREAFMAGQHYDILADWLDEVIDDMGHVVAQHLAHDADQKQASRQAPASGEVEPVMELDISEDRCFSPILIDATLSLPAGHYELYTHPPAKVPERLVQLAEEAITDAAAEAQEGGTYEPVEWANLVVSTLTTPTPATTPEAERHEWNDVGERCLKCGDKDWFAGPVCKGRTPPQEQ